MTPRSEEPQIADKNNNIPTKSECGCSSSSSSSSNDEGKTRTIAWRASESTSLLQDNHISSPSSERRLLMLRRARKMLYISHLFSQFSEVAWQFCLILFLAAFANYQSLILVSTYGLVSFGSVCIFGPKAGRYVDASNRLVVAQRFILSQNCCVIIASWFCYLLLAKNNAQKAEIIIAEDLEQQQQEQQQYAGNMIVNWLSHRLDGIPSLDWVSISLLLGIHFLGAAAMILDKGFLVAMERDWVVVMSASASTNITTDMTTTTMMDQDSKDWLAETNVAMKQIDLGCKVLAPAMAGFLLDAFDNSISNNTDRNPHDPHNATDNLQWAAIIVGAINAAALIMEYICTKRIYYMLPALAIQNNTSNSNNNDNSNGTTTIATKSDEEDQQQEGLQQQVEQHQRQNPPSPSKRSLSTQVLPSSMRIYLEQTISVGGISLSLLYLNVLSFGGIMTAYLVWRGMRLDTIGIWRGVSSAIGLLGTFAYHFSAKRTDLINTGMWSISYQFSCLTLSYISLYFMNNYNLSMTLLIGGVCSSRIGLWVFDITITQLMQEHIPDGIRGVVGGVQQSLNAFFQLLAFALGILFPDPKDFYIYVSCGYASVGVAMILYSIRVYARKATYTHTD